MHTLKGVHFLECKITLLFSKNSWSWSIINVLYCNHYKNS